MNKIQFILTASLILSGCQSLTYQEQQQLSELKYKGISVEHPAGAWERPANPAAAGALNLLP